MSTLNEVYSSLSSSRRYEVWFLRLGLADDSGAWWLRYLLMNPGRSGCPNHLRGMPVQVWATWFPQNGKPQTFIQEFPMQGLDLSSRGKSPFHFRIGDCTVGEDSCRGNIDVAGHKISWDLSYRSSFRVTLSNKGWIGFSRTPHSDAVFSGHITFDGQTFSGSPLGFGVQGHNCAYRHRDFWAWTHAYFPRKAGPSSTLEALVYEMPLGMVFRKAVLWHEGKSHEFRDLEEIRRDRNGIEWNFRCSAKNGFQLEGIINGIGPSLHRLHYVKTDCKGSFEVTNNSLSAAVIHLKRPDGPAETLETSTGAVLEMVGN